MRAPLQVMKYAIDFIGPGKLLLALADEDSPYHA
jgi:hypothetical protein